MRRTPAVALLTSATNALRRKEARELIASGNGRHWQIKVLEHEQGKPKVLLPIEENGAAQITQPPKRPGQTSIFDPGISATPGKKGGTNPAPENPAPALDFSREVFTPTVEREPGQEG
jgi:hypothetical protein